MRVGILAREIRETRSAQRVATWEGRAGGISRATAQRVCVIFAWYIFDAPARRRVAKSDKFYAKRATIVHVDTPDK